MGLSIFVLEALSIAMCDETADKSLSGYPLLLKCNGSMAWGGWVK